MSLAKYKLNKESKFKPKQLLTGLAGVYATGTAVSALRTKGNEIVDEQKAKQAVAYAKRKHPELRRRSDRDLATWMKGIYAISPRVATSSALAASALLTIDAYNGNFDLATAKILADINKGASVTESDMNSHTHGMMTLANSVSS